MLEEVARGRVDDLGLHNASTYDVGADRRGQNPIGFREVRNYFVFDLSTLGPSAVTSATLRIFEPAPGGGNRPSSGYQSPDPSETYAVYDVTTVVATLTSGAGGVAAFEDLGTGALYGSRVVTLADNGTFIEITLNGAAIDALNASGFGAVAFGGALTTLSPVMGMEDNLELIFNRTSTAEAGAELVLATTIIPEPSTALLLGTGLAALAARRRLRRQ